MSLKFRIASSSGSHSERNFEYIGLREHSLSGGKKENPLIVNLSDLSDITNVLCWVRGGQEEITYLLVKNGYYLLLLNIP